MKNLGLMVLGCLCIHSTMTLRGADAADPLGEHPAVTGELERLRAGAAEHPQDVKAQKELAEYCLKKHFDLEALTAASGAAALAPSDNDASRLYITALARNGRYQEAIDAYQTSWAGLKKDHLREIEEAASIAKTANDQMQNAVTREDYRRIAGDLDKGASKDPDNLAIQLTLGWVWLDKVYDPNAALPHLAKVVRYHPQDLDGRKLYGSACSQTGRESEAVTQFRAALAMRPDDPWIKANLGRALAKEGRWGEADKMYTEVLQTDPNNRDAQIGQAELAAWRGHSHEALDKLHTVLQQDPTNLEALTLTGDVNRWDWNLTEARQDYNQALTIFPNYYNAEVGLGEADKLGLPDVHANGYWFEDTTGFTRESVSPGVRLGVSDHVYVLADAAAWEFKQNNVTNIDRYDGLGGLEIDANRWLTLSGEGGVYDYRHSEPSYGGNVAIKLTPAPQLTIYTVGWYNQPYVSSIVTVSNQLKEESIGNGAEWKLGGRLAVENSVHIGRISDGNYWWQDTPDLSFRLFGANPGTWLRAEYQYMNFSHTNAGYWSPQHWDTVGPVLDSTLPVLGNWFSIVVDARAPYVFQRSKFGGQLQAGPAIQLFNRVELSAAYLYSSIPGDQGAWSGHGAQAAVKIRL